MGMRPAQIELSIDELILDAGVAGALSPRALQALRAEVEHELARLLNAGELPAQLQHSLQIEAVDAGHLARGDAHRGGHGEQLGAQIAQSVYRSLAR
ncbi:hypothetical protein [Caldilinea sp.]|jgi:hypothetical protein|uniref:hypothetical protein n=1 Tax=Caldilinea sp. TaxID=2293560 RepID=UPI001B01DC3B|nr:hypothetical protein [Caldilinea sp.]MBO9392137.1 hypothetical protein [Caldilinea sp.]